MLDIRFVRENPEAVKENIRKKFQEEKLVLVDEVLALDKEFRASKTEGDSLRGDRNRLSPITATTSVELSTILPSKS